MIWNVSGETLSPLESQVNGYRITKPLGTLFQGLFYYAEKDMLFASFYFETRKELFYFMKQGIYNIIIKEWIYKKKT
jgi:hypothetical protein